MTTITIDELLEKVDNQNGRVFGVTFTKKTNGELRRMACRRGVTKGVKGVVDPAVRRAEDRRNKVLTVFDMNVIEETGSEKGAFRRINLAQLIDVTLDGVKYNWNPATGTLKS